MVNLRDLVQDKFQIEMENQFWCRTLQEVVNIIEHFNVLRNIHLFFRYLGGYLLFFQPEGIAFSPAPVGTLDGGPKSPS